MTAPTLTLETDDEREVWVREQGRYLDRFIDNGQSQAVLMANAGRWADDAVRAYRERCAPAPTNPGPRGRRLDVTLRGIESRLELLEADSEHPGKVFVTVARDSDSEDDERVALVGLAELRQALMCASPARLGCTIPEAMRDRRAAGESVESLARDFGWDAADVRAVTESVDERGREMLDLRAALSVARECREKAEARLDALTRGVDRVARFAEGGETLGSDDYRLAMSKIGPRLREALDAAKAEGRS